MLNEAGDEGRRSAHARRGALHSKGEDSVKVSVDVLSVQEVGHVESLVHGVVRIFVFRTVSQHVEDSSRSGVMGERFASVVCSRAPLDVRPVRSRSPTHRGEVKVRESCFPIYSSDVG